MKKQLFVIGLFLGLGVSLWAMWEPGGPGFLSLFEEEETPEQVKPAKVSKETLPPPRITKPDIPESETAPLATPLQEIIIQAQIQRYMKDGIVTPMLKKYFEMKLLEGKPLPDYLEKYVEEKISRVEKNLEELKKLLPEKETPKAKSKK